MRYNIIGILFYDVNLKRFAFPIGLFDPGCRYLKSAGHAGFLFVLYRPETLACKFLSVQPDRLLPCKKSYYQVPARRFAYSDIKSVVF